MRTAARKIVGEWPNDVTGTAFASSTSGAALAGGVADADPLAAFVATLIPSCADLLL
jgi:hypothetical protein